MANNAHLTAHVPHAGETSRSRPGRRIFSLLCKLCTLSALATGIYYGAPRLVTLLMVVEAGYLVGQLPHLPSSEAISAIFELADLGPPGARAIVRAFVHADDAAAEVAGRILWEKMFTQEVSPQARVEALAVADTLAKNWHQIPVSRRGIAGKILQEFLRHFKAGNAAEVLVIQQCTKLLRKESADSPGAPISHLAGEDAPGIREIEGPFPSPGLVNPLRPSSQAKPLVTATHRETTVGPNARPTSAADFATGRGEPPSPQGGSVVPTVVYAPQTSPERLAVAGLSGPEFHGESFGPGKLPPALFLEQDAPGRPLTAGTSHDAPPPVTPQPSKSDDQAGGRESSSAHPTLEPLPRETGRTSPGVNIELPQNPWYRDRSLFCALSGGAGPSDLAWARLKELGWPIEAIELGRLAFHPDPQQRRKAVIQVWSLATVDPIPLLEYLSGDPDAAVRYEVLTTLATIPGLAAPRLVERFAREDPDPHIRAMAEELLSKRSPR